MVLIMVISLVGLGLSARETLRERGVFRCRWLGGVRNCEDAEDSCNDKRRYRYHQVVFEAIEHKSDDYCF